MTKKIVIFLLLVFLSSNALWADNFWGFDNNGGSIAMDIITIAVGGGFAAIPLFDPFETEEYNYYLYGLGGGLALFGIIGLIYDLTTSDSNYYVLGKNPILEHIVLNVSHKTMYVGVTWRF